jgi:hypothetical protein
MLLDCIFENASDCYAVSGVREVQIRETCCILRNRFGLGLIQYPFAPQRQIGDPGHNISVSWLTVAWRSRRRDLCRTRRVDLQRPLMDWAVIGSLPNRDMSFLNMTNALPSRTVPL